MTTKGGMDLKQVFVENDKSLWNRGCPLEAGDILLVCDRERDQDIKEMVKQINSQRGFDRFVQMKFTHNNYC